MNEIQIFTGAFGTIRTVTINNEPYFVGKDVADILGYSNPRDALSKHVDDEDRSDVAIHDGSQNRNMTVINESGLYRAAKNVTQRTVQKRSGDSPGHLQNNGGKYEQHHLRVHR